MLGLMFEDLLMSFPLFSLWPKRILWPGLGTKNSKILQFLFGKSNTKMLSDEEQKLVAMFVIYHREYERERKTKMRRVLY